MAKIRLGFVSNSSSSSFIIASENPEKLKVVVEIDLGEFVDETLSDLDGVERYFEEKYGEGFREDEYAKKLFNACKRAIKDGKSVCVGTVGSDGGDGSFLYENGFVFSKNANVDVIQGVNE